MYRMSLVRLEYPIVEKQTSPMKTDIAVIGGGLVGLATAYQLKLAHPEKGVTVIEKEAAVCMHQSGHNSGVIHTGMYYKPGSSKALNCTKGRKLITSFCREFGVKFEVCGKLIVATDESELPALKSIFERGRENGVRCDMIDQAAVREIEPHVRAVKAIHVKDAGIIDYKGVANKLAELLQERGGTLRLSSPLTGSRRSGDGFVLESPSGEVEARYVIACAGLQSDRVSSLLGLAPEGKIVPFKGEYYSLKPERAHLCKHLIYPVPDPSFPFLGVHFTRMIDGTVECGPNAVLALAREGYTKLGFNLKDAMDTLGYAGFRKLAKRYWRTGAREIARSLSKGQFARSLARLIPEVTASDIVPAAPGIRAQAVDSEGKLIDDFSIREAPGVVSVLNAPSPAATSCLSLGIDIAGMLSKQF